MNAPPNTTKHSQALTENMLSTSLAIHSDIHSDSVSTTVLNADPTANSYHPTCHPITDYIINATDTRDAKHVINLPTPKIHHVLHIFTTDFHTTY